MTGVLRRRYRHGARQHNCFWQYSMFGVPLPIASARLRRPVSPSILAVQQFYSLFRNLVIVVVDAWGCCIYGKRPLRGHSRHIRCCCARCCIDHRGTAKSGQEIRAPSARFCRGCDGVVMLIYATD